MQSSCSACLILCAGFILFLRRKPLIARISFPFSGDIAYRETLAYIRWAGTTVLHTQSGFVRYYLVIILGAVAAVLIVSGTLSNVTEGLRLLPSDLSVTITDLAKIFMLCLTVAAGVLTVIVREHVKAAIAYGVIGYAIGVIFLIDHAPDVALVAAAGGNNGDRFDHSYAGAHSRWHPIENDPWLVDGPP